MTDGQNQIIDLLSKQIAAVLHRLKHEEYFPGRDPDTMDQIITDSRKAVDALRAHRTQLEDLFTLVSL